MSQDKDSVSVPQIRFFQFESDALGVFDKSVNLFRGDVNYTQKLFSMPGRHTTPKLEASVSIIYQSNLQNELTTQNLTAPTGILGLGWTLPLEKIVFQANGAASWANRHYQLHSNGIGGNLILTKTENGKEYYQLESYEFWIISYDPVAECWEVTQENGITKVYGGGVSHTSHGYKTSTGNSIAWGVRYGNWIGATRLTRTQDAYAAPVQYAREWYLSETRNIWGDTVCYEYNGFPRASDGLIEDVEQFVGDSSGKPYTKGVYLSKITDVFGRTAVFSYADKTYDTSTPGAPKEYQAAHSDQADITNPNGFQDSYETKYLTSIAINDASGTTLETLEFDYYPLLNLSGFSTDSYWYGVTFKRFLKSIRSVSPQGSSLPGFDYSYYTDESQTDANLGALQTVTIPQGAVARYEYVKQSLEICKRSVEIPKPQPDIIGSGSPIPRVWFGQDFTVVTWYNPLSGKLWLGIYTWLGHWELWNPANPIIYDEVYFDGSDSLEVIVSDQSIGLTFISKGTTYLFVYKKDPTRSGHWISYNEGGSGYLTFQSTKVSFSAGTHFLLAVEENTLSGAYTLSRVTWNWKTQSWVGEREVLTETSKTLFATGAGEYYLTVAYDPSTGANALTLNYLGQDASGNIAWLQGGQQTVNNVWPINNQSQHLAAGASTAALAAVTEDTPYALNYDLYALMWDENYAFQSRFSKESFAMQKNADGEAPVSIVPRVIANSIVASGEVLLRFNGSTWLSNKTLQVAQPSTASDYWYAHGNDFTLRTVNSGSSGISVDMLVYDPDNSREINDWAGTEPIQPQPAPQPPSIDPQQAYFPTAAGEDFFTSGNAIYYRRSSTDWITPSREPVFTIVGQIDTTSMIDEGPAFLAYRVPDVVQPQNTKTVVLELENGQVKGTGQVFINQTYSLDDTSGTAPSGPGALVTYPGDTENGKLDNAESLTLYRYAGNAIAGNLVHYPVSRLNVSNGFGEDSPTSYVFDPASAACDPSGKVVKYYRSTVYPGSETADGSQFGAITNHYINGYNDDQDLSYYLNGRQVVGKVAYPTLDGYKLSVQTTDSQNNILRQMDHGWEIFTRRNRSPTEKDPQAEQLYGSYARQRTLEHTLDGVKSTTSSNYIPNGFDAPFSGLEIDASQSNCNGQGQAETQTKSKTYGYEKYPDLAALNYLNVVVQTTHFVTPDGQAAIPTSAQADTWKAWEPGKWGKYQSFKWRGGVSCAFPFPADYADPEGWVKHKQITARNDQGLIQETTDALAVPHSVLYDRNGDFVIAEFHNASLAKDEADYYGFEAIEQGSGWAWNAAAKIIAGNGYTGYRSLCLGPDGTLSRSYRPTARQVYALAYWYQTPAGYTPEQRSGWTVTVSSETNANSTVLQKPFADTQGAWVFDYLTIDLSGYSPDDTVTLMLKAANMSSAEVIIDNVRMVPDLSGFAAHVYDASRSLILTTMGQGTHLERNFYDEFDRRIGTVGPFADQLNRVYLNYLSRQGNADGFAAQAPNSKVQVQALDGGFNETFLDCKSWQAHWNASNPDTHWTSGNGRLVHTTASTSDTLSLCDPQCQGDFYLGFGLTAIDSGQPLVLTDEIDIDIGADNHFSWNPATRTWRFTVAGQSVQPICDWDVTPLAWSLLFKEKTVLFYVNGRVLLSVVSDSVLSGAPSLSTGKNAFAFYYLSLAMGPKTGVNFDDAMGHARQHQALDAANGIVFQSVTDPRGKHIVKTKMAPAFFGDVGKDTPLMTYRSGFIDMPAFLDSLNGSGEMTGDLSTYFNGEYGASDDQNYPYHRRLRERSPLARVVEQGAPGKSYAIVDPWTVDPMTRKTVKFAYSNNKTTPVLGVDDLPSGEYYVKTRTDQNGVSSHAITSQTHTRLVKAAPPDATTDAQTANLINRRFTVYAAGGRTEQQRLPNYFDTTLPDNDKFVIFKRFDPLNNMVETSTPDNGSTQVIYNSAGHARFQRDARGAVEGYYAYVKYDALNRAIEKGILPGFWNPATLQEKADDPTWPQGLSGQFIQKQLAYIGYVDCVNGLGRLASVTTHGEDGKGITVSEVYHYDAHSRVQSVTTQVSDPGGSLYQNTVGYSHTAAGSLSQVIYPSVGGIDVGTVHYSYDDLGRLIGVGKSQDEPNTYAAYTYTPDGKHASEILNAGGIETAFAYHPPGWLAAMTETGSNKGFSEKLPDYYPDGMIETVSDTLQGTGFEAALDSSAAYNPVGALTSVEYQHNADWNLSVSAYDPNGNFLSLSHGTLQETYTYNPGTNQTRTMTAGKTALNLDYDAKGGVSQISFSDTPSGTALGFTYMKNGFLTSRIDLMSSGDALDIYYGPKDRRALKQLRNGDQVKSRKFYLHGIHDLPLMETTDEGPTAYIYGANELVAFTKGGETYFVVRDHRGSNRMVYDANNTVQAAWSYSSFGEKQIVYEAKPKLLSYLYAGREWDEKTGLYNFRARLYDPRLRRFYFTDPKNQFAGAYVFIGDDPRSMVDPSGMWSVGDGFLAALEGIIALAEVAFGGVIAAASGGAATVAGGILIGAGLSLASNMVEEGVDEHKVLGWKGFGEAEATGAVSGLVAGSLGELGDYLGGTLGDTALGDAAAEDTAKQAGKKAVGITLKVGIGGVGGGSAAGVAGKFVENLIEGEPLSEGLVKEIWVGALVGFSGSGLGVFNEIAISNLTHPVPKVITAVGFGAVAGVWGGALARWTEGKNFRWLDLGLNASVGVVETLPGTFKKDNGATPQKAQGNDSSYFKLNEDGQFDVDSIPPDTF